LDYNIQQENNSGNSGGLQQPEREGFRKLCLTTTYRKRIIQDALSDYNIQKENNSGCSVRLQHPDRQGFRKLCETTRE
jgi:hypothetical protein